MGRVTCLFVFAAGLLCVPSGSAVGQVVPPPAGTDRPDQRPAISFEGNESYTASELSEVASQEITAAQGDSGSAGDLVDAAASLEAWYREHGFPDARVRVRMLADGESGEAKTVTDTGEFDSVDRAVFLISEGARLYLGTVTFDGNEAFDDSVLRRYVSRRGGEVLGAGRALYRPDEIDAVASHVERHYRLAGYLRVSVGKPEITRTNGTVDVRYEVREGPRFTVSAVELPRPAALPDRLATAVEELAPDDGQAYTERLASDGADRIERYLGERGYLTDVRYTLSTDEAAGTVTIAYQYAVSGQTTLGSIRLAHKEETRIREAVVRNRFDLEPGEPLDRTAVEAGREALYRSGLFALVTTELVESGESRMDLVVSVEEAENRYAEVAAGWSSEEQLLGSAEYVDRNLFGSGRLWAIRGDGSFLGYRFSTRFVDRFLLGRGGRVLLRVEHALRLRQSYADRSTRTSVAAELPLGEAVRAASDVELSYSRIDDFSDPSQEEPDVQRVRLATLDARAIYDTLDSPLFPTDGTEAGVDVAVSADLGTFALRSTRVRLWGAYHRPVGRRVLVSALASGTAILPIGESEIPISQRLYAGGSDSVRSFSQDTLSPVNATGDPVGGLTRLEATLETRVRVVENLYAALFYDVAMVSREALEPTIPGHALGAGLRYRLPVGPIRVDVGLNPGPRFAAERGWAVHLSVGSGF